MTTNEILGWTISHLLAFGAGMCLGFGFNLAALGVALAAIIAAFAVQRWLYESVTPGHSYDPDDLVELPAEDCPSCMGTGKVQLVIHGELQTHTCAVCMGSGQVYEDEFGFR